MKKMWIALAVLLALPVVAQESASYRLTEHTFNAGGHPSGGVSLVSSGYKITLDAIGGSVAGPGPSSASYRMEGGFISGYPPPGEVLGLRFADGETLTWNPERSAGDYNLYREPMSDLVALGYGDCEQQEIAGSATTDSDEPPTGDGYFYLVTVENRLDEEGPKGWDSGNSERHGNVCP